MTAPASPGAREPDVFRNRERTDVTRNRRAILDAAIELYGQRSRTSMGKVALQAGVTRATVYRHFPTRDALCAAIKQEALDEVSGALVAARLDTGPAPEALARAVRLLVPVGLRFQAVLTECADLDPQLLAPRAEVFAPVHETVLRGQATGEIDPRLPAPWVEAALAALLTAVVRQAQAAGAAGGRLDDDAMAEQAAATLLEGLRR